MASWRVAGRVAERLKPIRDRFPRAFFARVLQTRGAGFGLVVIVIVVLLAVCADLIAPFDPDRPVEAGSLVAPSVSHLLGTDHLSRDVLSRIIYGSRISLQAGVISVGLSLCMGISMGLMAGFYGGVVDDLLMRLVDALYSFPMMVLALAISANLGPGLRNAMIAIAIVFTPAFARLVRGQTLSVREREFVTAARVAGAGPWRMMLRHILPNVTAPVVVQASLMVAQAIIVEAGLSFLGLGVQPPTASWGSMLRVGYQYLEAAPWTSFAPGTAIFLTVLAFNLLGDGMRRALDPRLWQRGEA